MSRWVRTDLAEAGGGPINTLLKVRTSSQQLRAHYEQELVQDFLSSELGKNPLPVTPAYFEYEEDSTTPLSWHLRTDQKEKIDAQWATQRDSEEARKVYTAHHCPGAAQSR